MKAGRVRLISLEVAGPRSKADQQAFIEALLDLSKKHGVTIHGLEKLPRKARAKRKAVRRRPKA